MKHILIDGTTMSRRIDGLTQYILNVILRLDISLARYTLLVRHGECPDNYLQQILDKGIAVEEVNIAPIGPIRDIQFARYLNRNPRFDAAFIPSNQYPIALKLPAVYVIHDLIYEQFPEQLGKFSGLKRLYLRMVVGIGLKRAQKVVAVSNYTRTEIIHYHGDKYNDKINVIYEGWEHLKRSESPSAHVEMKVDFSEYILYVGSSRGHKNLSRLVAAIKQCQQDIPAGTGVVIVGNTRMFRPEQLHEISLLNQEKKIIHLTGWVSDEELDGYFRNAKALIFPSLSEGFGIPILEAYYYKIPLLLSNQASLPEVAGDAAIYFNPYDVDDMVEKLVQCMNTNDYTELLAKQTKRLELYSWTKTSRQIEAIIHSI